jgi:hypothetical protein
MEYVGKVLSPYDVGTRRTCRAEWMSSSAMGMIRAGRTETRIQLSGQVGGLLPSGGIWVDVGHITARAGLESTLSSCGVSPMQTDPWTHGVNAGIQGVSGVCLLAICPGKSAPDIGTPPHFRTP